MSDTVTTTGQKVAAEVLGTFVLVFFGAAPPRSSPAGSTCVAIVAGLRPGAGASACYAFGRISGGPLQPRGQRGRGLSGRMSWRQVPHLRRRAGRRRRRSARRCCGSLLQRLSRRLAARRLARAELLRRPGGFAWWGALMVEVAAAPPILVGVILAVTDARNEHPAVAPLAIGLTLAALHLVAIPLTGTSVNPARSIGPALFSRHRRARGPLAVHPRAAPRRGDRRPALPRRCSATAPTRSPGSGLALGRARRVRGPPSRATARRTSSSRSGTSASGPPTSRRTSRSRSSRTAGSGTTRRRSGSRSSSGPPPRRRRSTSRTRGHLGHLAP